MLALIPPLVSFQSTSATLPSPESELLIDLVIRVLGFDESTGAGQEHYFEIVLTTCSLRKILKDLKPCIGST